MRSRLLVIAAALCGAASASCRDIPAPDGGVLSVSPLLLPSPAVVVGDTMRDSLGAAAPLRVIAYDVNGDSVAPQPTPTFVVLDTGAHVADGFLIGDKAGTTVRVVATVEGLQTQPQTVLVTLRPDTLVPSDSAHQVRKFNFLLDTVVNTNLNVRVMNLDGATAGVDGVIVRYDLVQAPAVVGTGPSVLLLNGTTPSARDTTASQGQAARTLRLRRLAVDPAKVDSAIVIANASYRGQSLGVVQFTIVFQPQ